MKRMLAALSVLFLFAVSVEAESEDVLLLHQEQTVVLKRPLPRDTEPVDAVLIVQNHASDEFQKPLSNLGDRLSMALSGDLFNIIDPNDAIGDEQNRGPWGENMPVSSATRLAESLDAQALVTAAVGETSVVGFGAPARVQAARMTLTLSAKRLPKGANVAAVTVTETSSKMTPEALAQNADSVYSELVGRLVSKAAAEFLAKCSRVAWSDVAFKTIEVAFGCNFPGANVEIDGISCGTAGTIGQPPLRVKVSDGLHNLKISYPYTLPFEVRAKFQEGTTFMVVLRENDEGRRIRKEDRYFDTLMDRIEKSGATDDAVRMIRARGYGKYLASSYTRIEGMPQILSMRDCEMPDFGLNPDKEGDGVSTSTRDLFDQAGASLGIDPVNRGTGNENAPASQGEQPDAPSGVKNQSPLETNVPASVAQPSPPVQNPVQAAYTPAASAQPAPGYSLPTQSSSAPPVSGNYSSPSSEPSAVDVLHDVREGVDTSKDIIQGIKDIGEMLK
jgi:hypothetical protein